MTILTKKELGLVTAFEYYKNLLILKGYKSINHTEIQNGDATSLEHLLWMCEKCITSIKYETPETDLGKCNRWLGFIQGCLIMHGLTTVQEERDRTRPWFKEGYIE